jgi:murein DD-endopeptidase MepM/ murein hydrolase activator NlpD
MKAFRTTYQLGDATLVEQLFAAGGFAEAWEHADNLERLQIALREQMEDLLATKEALTVDLNATQKKQNELAALKRELTGQKQVLDQNRAEQAKLLSDTKNQESAYQALLKSKQEAKEAFEKQLSDYEAQLKFNLDPTSIPKAGSGVLSFPIDPAFMNRCQSQKSVYGNIYCLTQYFGNTDFAKSGAYNGKGHNGVDFGTPTGTKIVAALSGRVVATGNTDAQKSCYSYGKWVLVEHGNGLSTLYAHLSVISVVAGDQLPTGGLIGYSGKTGYATGPHLHFTVYVSSAVKVVRYGDVVSKTNCGNVSMPVAPTEAYLNPMSYL